MNQYIVSSTFPGPPDAGEDANPRLVVTEDHARLEDAARQAVDLSRAFLEDERLRQPPTAGPECAWSGFTGLDLLVLSDGLPAASYNLFAGLAAALRAEAKEALATAVQDVRDGIGVARPLLTLAQGGMDLADGLIPDALDLLRGIRQVMPRTRDVYERLARLAEEQPGALPAQRPRGAAAIVEAQEVRILGLLEAAGHGGPIVH